MNFFLKKQLIKFSCTYWPLSFCKILKKFLEPIQSYEDVPFSGPKWPICHKQFFLGTNHYYYFHLPIGPFHCAKFKKILTTHLELWGCTIFRPKMVHLPQFFLFFFFENYWYHSYLPISPFHCAEFLKNPSSGARVMRILNFWAPNENFFFFFFFSENLLMSLFFSFMPIYMPKIKVRYYLLKKYWQLKNNEISLVESHFWLKLETRFFPSMLFSHNVNEP